MPSLKLTDTVRGPRERGLVFIKTPISKALSLIKQQKRKASDHIGSLITREWENVPGGCITTIDSVSLPQVLQIYHNSFDSTSDGLFRRYSKIFSHIFYVAKIREEIVGYCVYYIIPSFSLYGIRKSAVVYSIAVDGDHRGYGIGRHLLNVSIQEMKANRINEIFLYVNKRNPRAISLYTKFGFDVIGELSNICGKGEECYKMKLALESKEATIPMTI